MNGADTSHMQDKPSFSLSHNGQQLILKAFGRWTLHYMGEASEALGAQLGHYDYDQVYYDFDDVVDLDTAGAYVLASAIRCESGICYLWNIKSPNKGQTLLMNEAAAARMGETSAVKGGVMEILERLGRSTHNVWNEFWDTLAFVGHFVVVMLRLVVRPHKIRWTSVTAMIEEVGLNAAPIVMMLSFFIGAVIAYMGANLLASFGAQIFMVELVGFSVLREFAVLITAIMLAGRSDSAFTAQIGAMQMRQEIDAMTVIGLDTYETLVVPRAIACLICAPLLTFLAMLSGLFGGMLVAWLGPTDVPPILFLSRLKDTVDISHYWVGLVKAPFFGLVIAIIGCRQGLAVSGSVESLGARTTSSVVQAIFTVITMDAIFAMIFMQMGV